MRFKISEFYDKYVLYDNYTTSKILEKVIQNNQKEAKNREEQALLNHSYSIIILIMEAFTIIGVVNHF